MKQLLFIACLLGSLAGYEKSPLTPEPEQAKSSPAVKIEGKSRRWRDCYVKYNNNPVAKGETCEGEGTQCGRKPYCRIIGPVSISENNEIYGDMTFEEFAEMWNSDEGRRKLQERGFYEEIAE